MKIVCYSSCLTCNGPTSSNCLSCQAPLVSVFLLIFDGLLELLFMSPSFFSSLQSLNSGECTSNCTVGYFPNSQQVCQACFQTCETCSGSGFSECTSCNSTSFFDLLDQSTCTSACGQLRYAPQNTYICISMILLTFFFSFFLFFLETCLMVLLFLSFSIVRLQLQWPCQFLHDCWDLL